MEQVQTLRNAKQNKARLGRTETVIKTMREGYHSGTRGKGR